jgi:hypothetical protein
LYGYVWLTSLDFNIDEHVIEINDTNLQTTEDLQCYVSKLMAKHEFKLDKPLWSIYYKKGFGPEKSTVLFFVYHMCFSDGVSLIRLFFKGIIDNRMELDIKPRFAYFSFYFDLLKHLFFGWSRIFCNMLAMRKDRNPLHKQHFKSNSYMDLNLNSFVQAKPEENNSGSNRSRVSKQKLFNLVKKNISFSFSCKMNTVPNIVI